MSSISLSLERGLREQAGAGGPEERARLVRVWLGGSVEEGPRGKVYPGGECAGNGRLERAEKKTSLPGPGCCFKRPEKQG